MKRFELTAQAVGDGSALPAGARLPGGLALAIGFFDGVHRGHADVVRQAVEAGRARGLTPAVMTFDPHPRTVLGHGGGRYCTVLTPLADKLALMADLGIEAAYVIRFDRDFAQVTAERFVRELLFPLDVRTAVVGFDFAFGNRGAGNAETLRRDGGGEIDVIVADKVQADDRKVSSTRIRDELAAGRCEAAQALLGRPYAVKGIVVHGQARGRQLGFPTANLALDQPYVIPKPGVYAVTADLIDDRGSVGRTCGGVLNVGYRPTFEKSADELRLEAHLFDYSGDLYGSEVRLHFHAYIREERKFPSLEALVEQIGLDAAAARGLLSQAPGKR